ncbi:siderophore-interacting protein [Roseivivax halodurans]|uniref:siderophore-interacting protein n=1 Tax=Roseivivax halodurans TaxID=93683 RepID=UPI001B7F8F7F|nr:siderophore-interacting protein [Roseivivax halodurans]
MTTRLAAAGIVCRWEITGSREQPHNLSFGTVERIDRISPSFTRISVTGPDLWRFAEGRLHFRLLFGPNGAGWPHLDASGVTAWPGGVESWHRPVYTTREIHRLGEAGARLVFDVFRHEGGRVTAWIDGVALGETVAITGPSGSRVPPAARRVDLVGDETAIPVIARIIAGLAAGTSGTARLFVPSEDDVQSLRAPEGFRVMWIPRDGGVLPVHAGLALPIPQADAFSFFAGERDDMLAVRARLIEASAPKNRYHVAAYWSKALAEG